MRSVLLSIWLVLLTGSVQAQVPVVTPPSAILTMPFLYPSTTSSPQGRSLPSLREGQCFVSCVDGACNRYCLIRRPNGDLIMNRNLVSELSVFTDATESEKAGNTQTESQDFAECTVIGTNVAMKCPTPNTPHVASPDMTCHQVQDGSGDNHIICHNELTP